MKRRILIGVDVNEWKHPDGHQGFDLEKMKDNWTESTVRAIIQSLRIKDPGKYNNYEVQSAWDAWQERAAQSTPPQRSGRVWRNE